MTGLCLWNSATVKWFEDDTGSNDDGVEVIQGDFAEVYFDAILP